MMVEWSIVIGLIALGCFLVWAEIVFVPGVFITALIGIICSTIGIYKAYDYFGSTTGHLILAGTIALNVLNLVFIFRGRSWDKFSLKDTSDSKVRDNKTGNVEIGDIGKTISTLKPVGKAEFGDQTLEVTALAGYVSENETVEVVRIESNKIVVNTK